MYEKQGPCDARSGRMFMNNFSQGVALG